MRNIFFMPRAGLIALAFLVSSIYSFATEWHSGDVIADGTVVTDDLVIHGGGAPIILKGKVSIKSPHVTIVDGDVTLQTAITPDAAQLHFITNDNPITVQVAHSLYLKGNANGTDLLITHEGENTTTFILNDGKSFVLTQGLSLGDGGAKFFVVMQDKAKPTVLFTRHNDSSDDDVRVVVGHKSLISFASTQSLPGTDEGALVFDPTNGGLGRMILDIQGKGGVVVTGHKMTVAQQPTQADINRKVSAGGRAWLSIMSHSVADTAGLLILNNNDAHCELLVDPFCQLGARTDTIDYNGSFSGNRYGFIIGNNGVLDIQNNSYGDYVGLTNNVCPNNQDSTKVKSRNPSALIIDGSCNPSAVPALIKLGDCSGLFFRSGVDNEGVVSDDYIVSPYKHTAGAGEIVFAVEGALRVEGSNIDCLDCSGCKRSKMEILSLAVGTTGGSLFVAPQNCPNIFPARTFEQDNHGIFATYNTAAWLINNRMDVYNSTIAHTDVNHQVYEKNDVESEPAYIGGETWQITLKTDHKPSINFYNANLFVHENIAFTGLNLRVLNPVIEQEQENVCISNLSRFVFFYNGKRCDKGTGRHMVLGTAIGATPCDTCCAVICNDAHLDIAPLNECEDGAQKTVALHLLTAPNDNSIIPPSTCAIDQEQIFNQFAIHTIYLGNTSNISVGLDADCDLLHTPVSHLLINGDFFSFQTRGGSHGMPECSGVTGEGGIFVDCNGKFSIGGVAGDSCLSGGLGAYLCKFIANMGVMVTRSRNGIIELPKTQVFFDPKVGVADWNLDLGVKQIIIPATESLSDYTLDWLATEKDYGSFCPYQVQCVDVCACPPVEDKNVTDVPTIQGQVKQLQIKGSRIGDPAHIKVDGGWVRECIFVGSNKAGEAPVAVVILENNGRIGLGSALRDIDSVYSTSRLGVNGITIIANGSGEVDLNSDLIINNVCAILKGPHFRPADMDGGDELVFNATTPRTLRVTNTGILDLSSFKEGDTIKFAGNVTVVFEPGARVVLNGCTITVADQAAFVCEGVHKGSSIFDVQTPSLHTTDPYRVKLHGVGTIKLANCAQWTVNRNGFLSIENWSDCNVLATDITIKIADDARMVVGEECLNYGGVLQVGDNDAVQRRGGSEAFVSFGIELQGYNASFIIGRQGFVGFGVGIADKASSVPNEWLVQALNNVKDISLNIFNGTFQHNLIYSGNNVRSSLLAFGQINGSYRFDCEPILFPGEHGDDQSANISQSSVLGGGNMVRVNPTDFPIQPIVHENVVLDGDLLTGILASKPLLNPPFTGATADELFNFLRTPLVSQCSGRADCGPNHLHNKVRVAYVDDTGDGQKIGRDGNVVIIIGQGGSTTEQKHSLEVGAVQVVLKKTGQAPREILKIFELP